MNVDSTKRLDELDSLRGLASLSVVLSHFKLLWLGDAMLNSSQLSRKILIVLAYPFSAGYEAVILFFILSGFVLAIPAIDSRAQTYPVFITRRIFRIYMPYLVALILAVLGASLFHGPITRSQWLHQFWSEPVDWHLVAQHIIFLGKYNTDQFDNPIWSLVYEMRVSFVFPFLCWIALKMRPVQSLILAVTISGISIFTSTLLPPDRSSTSIIYTMHYAALFVVGIYLARQRRCISESLGHRSRQARLGIAALSASLYVYGAFVCIAIARKFGKFDLHHSEDWLTALGAVGLIVMSLNSASIRRILLWRPVLALGKMSYSVYLLHFIVLLLFVHLLYGRFPLLIIFTICLVVVIAASWVFYRWVEIPFISLGRKVSGYL